MLPAGAARPAEPDGYWDLGFLNGGSYSFASAVSADGKVVVGYGHDGSVNNQTRAFRWTEAGNVMVSLGTLNNGSYSYALSVSADGKVVVGYSADSSAGNNARAYRWTESSSTMVSLGTLNNGLDSYAYDVRADGKVVVGYASDGNAGNARRAFRWTESSNTMVSLGTLNGGTSSVAYGVNADGKVVVGDADDGNAGNTPRAFRWTESSNTMVSLGTLNGGYSSYARRVSADGKVVVGFASDGSAGNFLRAFRWTEDTNTMVSLGSLNSGSQSQAYGVNADGSVVVGGSQDGNAGNIYRAFRWTDATGMISVEDWLRNNGVTVASDFTTEARGVSADGSVVVGTTVNSTAFIARVSSTGSGIIDVNEFYSSLAAKPTANVGLNFAGTVLNGAHGEPMRNLLDVGQQSIWVTSDIGYDNGSASDGAFGLADFGYGLGLEGGATARFAFGGLYTDQDIDTGGNFINKGFYIAPEVTLPVAGNAYATVGGYYAPGKLSVTRGYLNGGVMDYSSGEADLDTWGAKLRFDWLNAATVSDWNLTPYASLTYAHAKLDAYTETGGGFPASFNSASDHSTVVRAGVDGVHALNNDIRLLARAEAAYRFEDETASTSGTITGLSGFSFEGQDTNQFWLRGGLGAEVDVAGGTASLNVNVTTQGDDPTVWIRSGWKVTF
jgi:probable HAF family extracellular repeat protein